MHLFEVDRPIHGAPRKLRVGRGLTVPVGAVVITEIGNKVSLAKLVDGKLPEPGDYIRSEKVATASANAYAKPVTSQSD